MILKVFKEKFLEIIIRILLVYLELILMKKKK